MRFELVVLGLAGGTAAFVLLTLQQAAKSKSSSTRKGVDKAKRSKLE
jgi:hypothetical protein